SPTLYSFPTRRSSDLHRLANNRNHKVNHHANEPNLTSAYEEYGKSPSCWQLILICKDSLIQLDLLPKLSYGKDGLVYKLHHVLHSHSNYSNYFHDTFY